MSDFDIDIEKLLDDVMAGNDVELDSLDTPEPLSAPAPEPETPEPSHACEDQAVNDLKVADEETEVTMTEDGLVAITPQQDDPVAIATARIEETPEDVSDLPGDVPAAPAPVEQVNEKADEEIDAALARLPDIDEGQWSKEVEAETIKLPEFTTEDMMQSLDIRNFGTLVSLSTNRWHAKVRDHEAAKAAAVDVGADIRAYEARKRLLVGADEKLKKVHTAIDAARTEHYRMTLPWSTVGVNDHGKRAGPRLLPNTLFFEYTQKMGQYKQEMVDALDDFVAAYPKLMTIVQQKLGKAFQPSQYPAPSQIHKYFDLSFEFTPIPVSADFDSVQMQQADRLARAVNENTRAQLENALQDVWKRLSDDVTHAYNALKNPNARFHYTLIEKMRNHAQMLTHLNVSKDPRIETIRTAIEKGLCRWDVKQVRKDDALRKQLADSAKDVLTQMEAFIT